MPIQPLRYPLDLTGTSRDNLIQNERRELTASKVRVVVPSGGPFFTRSFVLRDTATGRIVPVGESYYFGNFHKTASTKAKAEIASMVIITDTRVSRNVSFDYQVIGGEFGYNHAAIIDQIEALQLDNRPIDWMNVTNKPIGYTPAKHLHDIGDIYGFEYLVNALEEIRQALLLGDEASHTAIYDYIERKTSGLIAEVERALRAANDHASRTDNPHRVTAAQVGTLTRAEINQLIADLRTVVNNHVNARGNVHGLTAAQLGVYTIAQIDAKFGDVNTNIRRVLDTHVQDRNNPHRVTAGQTGAYTKAETNNLLTPISTRISNHETNYNNPHKVSAAQVGTFTKAEIESKIKVVNDRIGPLVTSISEVNNRLTPIVTRNTQRITALEGRVTTLEGVNHTNLIKAYVEQHIIDPATRKLKKDVIPISTANYNSLKWNDNGLYTGSMPSATTANLYVDPDTGVDIVPTVENKAGTRAKPLRTLPFAIKCGDSGTERRIYLAEGKVHEWDRTTMGTVNLNGDYLHIVPYGPQTDAWRPVSGDGDRARSPRMLELNTRVVIKGTTGIRQGVDAVWHQTHFRGTNLIIRFYTMTISHQAGPFKPIAGSENERHYFGNGQGILEPWERATLHLDQCRVYTAPIVPNPTAPTERIATPFVHADRNSLMSRVVLYETSWDNIILGNGETAPEESARFMSGNERRVSQMQFMTYRLQPTYEQWAPKVSVNGARTDEEGNVLGIDVPFKKPIERSQFIVRGGRVYGKVIVNGVAKEIQLYPALYADTVDPLV